MNDLGPPTVVNGLLQL